MKAAEERLKEEVEERLLREQTNAIERGLQLALRALVKDCSTIGLVTGEMTPLDIVQGLTSRAAKGKENA